MGIYDVYASWSRESYVEHVFGQTPRCMIICTIRRSIMRSFPEIPEELAEEKG